MKNIAFVFVLFSMAACVTNPESGSRSFIITSEAEEAELGERAFKEVLAQERVSSNDRWTRILRQVGQRISAAANQPDFQWEFRLIESKEKNAFCLPGGKVAFFTGIFRTARTEAGLAAVMGHEVAHATARHGGQRLTLAFGTQLAFEGLKALMGAGHSTRRDLLLGALGVGTQIGVALPFSRANETEADQIGLIYMARAGYDPKEAVEFWQRFAAETKGAPPKFLSTHPPSEDRTRALAAQLGQVDRIYAGSAMHGRGETL